MLNVGLVSRLLGLLFVMSLAACGDDGGLADASGGCEADSDCSDGFFCNGVERCVAGGCESGPAPCTDGCDEATLTCADGGCVDGDGDGARNVACGGTDCDDENADRYPGATEICDAAGLDEDCDLATFGFRDQDMDGAPDATCCNGDVCGTDCDDNAPAINPTQDESCDELDNDCDGDVDEDVGGICYADADGDSYAAEGADTRLSCDCGVDETDRAEPLDCRDTGENASQVFPGATEVCNHLDEDCDSRFDESLSGSGCNLQVGAGDLPSDADRWSCFGGGSGCGGAPFVRSGDFGYLTDPGGGGGSSAIYLPEPVDLPHRVTARGVFLTSGRAGQVSTFVAPEVTSLTDRAMGIGGAPTAAGTLAATFDLADGVVRLWQAVAGVGWMERAASSNTIASRCYGTGGLGGSPSTVSLGLDIVDGDATLTLRCGTPTVEAMVTVTLADWRATYYDGPTPPTFHAGFSVAADSGLEAWLRSALFDREQEETGHEGVCVDCRSYGRAGLTY